MLYNVASKAGIKLTMWAAVASCKPGFLDDDVD